MTKPISAAAASSIEAAISRLMASDDVEARYTIACLASEAGLSRDTLDLVLKAGVTTGVGSLLPLQNDRAAVGHDQPCPY
jgi:hypothetical protein